MTRAWKYGALSLFLSAVLISGCSSDANDTGAASSGAEASNNPDASQTEQVADQGNKTKQTEDTDASNKTPSTPQGNNGATDQNSNEVERVVFDGSIGKGYHKKVELMKDGSEHVVITNPEGNIQVDKREYEGLITAVNGQSLTVQLKRGLEKQITIPAGAKLEDDTGKGYQVGLEIEWSQDADGNILEVELDD